MRLLLNIVWFVLAGLWMAIAYAVAALIMFVLIVTIPFGIASLRIGMYVLWPFGRAVVRRADHGAASTIGNILWFLLAGWWLALGHLVTGVLLCLTVIGIPLGIANFKLIPVSMTPLGREIVDVRRAGGCGCRCHREPVVSRRGRSPLTPDPLDRLGDDHSGARIALHAWKSFTPVSCSTCASM